MNYRTVVLVAIVVIAILSSLLHLLHNQNRRLVGELAKDADFGLQSAVRELRLLCNESLNDSSMVTRQLNSIFGGVTYSSELYSELIDYCDKAIIPCLFDRGELSNNLSTAILLGVHIYPCLLSAHYGNISFLGTLREDLCNKDDQQLLDYRARTNLYLVCMNAVRGK